MTTGTHLEKPDPLTPEQVAEMEAALANHYGERVAPISRYCNAIFEYAHAAKDSRDYGAQKAARALLENEIAIRKSNLLYRLLYLGWPVRKVPCPHHRGRWSGYGDCACNLGGGPGSWNDQTGWMPTEGEA